LVSEVFAGRLNELTENLLMVVVEHNRMKYLPQIIAKYDEFWEAANGMYRVKVVVSKQMEKLEVEKLTADIASAIDGRVRLELAVSPSIIGGIIIRYGNKVVDNSVRNRLFRTVKDIMSQRNRDGV
jgi:ATP synthase F1 delta subunit